jgi:Reverse transcriptase (RNA-dependent DNA polymerase)
MTGLFQLHTESVTISNSRPDKVCKPQQSYFFVILLLEDLSGRTQQVMYGGEQSVTSAMLFGVLQGTVLGPLLNVIYTTPLLSVFAKHRIDAHQYADDLQLYLCVPPAEASVGACLVDVEVWLKASRLGLNPSKTQVMWLGSAQQLAKVWLHEVLVLSSQIRIVDDAGNVGVVVDSCQCQHGLQLSVVNRDSFIHIHLLNSLSERKLATTSYGHSRDV